MTGAHPLRLLLVATTVLACADGGSDAADAAAAAGTRSALELVARIGSVDGGDQSLTRVGQVLIGPDERLYVSQPSDNFIRVFDQAGASVTAIGRAGGGPGEFSHLAYLGIRGDTLYASDDGLGRVSYFDLDGALIDSEQWASPAFSVPPVYYTPTAPRTLMADGTGIVEPMSVVAAASSPFEPGLRTVEWATPVVRIDRQARIVDTVTWRRSVNRNLVMVHEGQPFVVRAPFDDNPLHALMPDGRGVVVVDRRVAAASEGSFQVTLLGPARDTVFTRSFSYVPVRSTQEMLEREVDGGTSAWRARQTLPSVAAIASALRNEGAVHETLPPVTALVAAQDGTIWLRREAPGGEEVEWMVLDSGGEPQARLQLPARQTVAAARGDYMAAVELDELDVPFVVLYRITR
jgi:hypothetical protein